MKNTNHTTHKMQIASQRILPTGDNYYYYNNYYNNNYYDEFNKDDNTTNTNHAGK